MVLLGVTFAAATGLVIFKCDVVVQSINAGSVLAG